MVYALAQPGLELVTISLLNVSVADRVNCAGARRVARSIGRGRRVLQAAAQP